MTGNKFIDDLISSRIIVNGYDILIYLDHNFFSVKTSLHHNNFSIRKDNDLCVPYEFDEKDTHTLIKHMLNDNEIVVRNTHYWICVKNRIVDVHVYYKYSYKFASKWFEIMSFPAYIRKNKKVFKTLDIDICNMSKDKFIAIYDSRMSGIMTKNARN